MSRRDFLKTVVSFIIAFGALRFQQLLKFTKSKTNRVLEEAKFYKVADDLAG